MRFSFFRLDAAEFIYRDNIVQTGCNQQPRSVPPASNKVRDKFSAQSTRRKPVRIQSTAPRCPQVLLLLVTPRLARRPPCRRPGRLRGDHVPARRRQRRPGGSRRRRRAHPSLLAHGPRAGAHRPHARGHGTRANTHMRARPVTMCPSPSMYRRHRDCSVAGGGLSLSSSSRRKIRAAFLVDSVTSV